MEPPFDELAGVVSTTSGYTGGTTANPTYEQVSAGRTGHAEAVEIVYDPRKVTLRAAARSVLAQHRSARPPTRSSATWARQYRAAIFVHDEAQRQLAEASKAALASGSACEKPIVTEIAAASPFWPAEEYHQDYYKKNPIRYKFYRYVLRPGRAASRPSGARTRRIAQGLASEKERESPSSSKRSASRRSDRLAAQISP